MSVELLYLSSCVCRAVPITHMCLSVSTHVHTHTHTHAHTHTHTHTYTHTHTHTHTHLPVLIVSTWYHTKVPHPHCTNNSKCPTALAFLRSNDVSSLTHTHMRTHSDSHTHTHTHMTHIHTHTHTHTHTYTRCFCIHTNNSICHQQKCAHLTPICTQVGISKKDGHLDLWTEPLSSLAHDFTPCPALMGALCPQQVNMWMGCAK